VPSDSEAGLVRLERLVARLRGEPEVEPPASRESQDPVPVVAFPTLRGTALDRALVERGALSDAEAAEILKTASRPEAERALDRLARVDPRRAVALWRLRSGASGRAAREAGARVTEDEK
jgi:hypothetical protein